MRGPRTVGGNIAAAREAKGWSVEQAADAAGLSNAAYAAIEQDRDDPLLSVLSRIASALDVEVADLLADVA